MINRNQELLSKYLKYLQAVYKGEKNNSKLIRKYSIGANVQQALKDAGFSDRQGFSTMQREPSIKDAQKVLLLRSKYDRGEIKTKKYNKRIKPQIVPIAEKPSKGREISILWGMIKIKS